TFLMPTSSSTPSAGGSMAQPITRLTAVLSRSISSSDTPPPFVGGPGGLVAPRLEMGRVSSCSHSAAALAPAVAKRAEAGPAVVGAPADRGEARDAHKAIADRPALDGERRAALGGAPDDHVGIVVEPGELRVVQPGLLQELELPGDVGVQRDEVEAPIQL